MKFGHYGNNLDGFLLIDLVKVAAVMSCKKNGDEHLGTAGKRSTNKTRRQCQTQFDVKKIILRNVRLPKLLKKCIYDFRYVLELQ